MCNCEHAVHFSNDGEPVIDHAYRAVPAGTREHYFTGCVCDHCADVHYAEVIE